MKHGTGCSSAVAHRGRLVALDALHRSKVSSLPKPPRNVVVVASVNELPLEGHVMEAHVNIPQTLRRKCETQLRSGLNAG